MDPSSYNRLMLLLQLPFPGQDSDDNGYNGHSISVGLMHKDEAIYRAPLMLSPTESPIAVDNETSPNGVISHRRGFVKLNELLYQGW